MMTALCCKPMATTSFATALLLPIFALSIASTAESTAKTTVELNDAQGKSVGTAVLWSETGKRAQPGGIYKTRPS